MQAIGSPVGAYLVQHLDPQRLQFAIATALLFLFLLMVLPVAKCIRQARMRRARFLRHGASLKHPGGLARQHGSARQPLLLPGETGAGQRAWCRHALQAVASCPVTSCSLTGTRCTGGRCCCASRLARKVVGEMAEMEAEGPAAARLQSAA